MKIKERGIIFNSEMVRAIIDGHKTQTRRVMKVQPQPSKAREGEYWFPSRKLETMVHVSDLVEGNSPIDGCHHFFQEHCCPFGKVGDRLWVRETWCSHGGLLTYRSDNDWIKGMKKGSLCPAKWSPSVHMPRWASRITLEITDIRVERLNDISEQDAESEGVYSEVWDQTVVARNYLDKDAYFQFWSEDMPDYIEDMRELFRFSFRSLWKSIYGQDSWQSNPWVWLIEFKKVDA